MTSSTPLRKAKERRRDEHPVRDPLDVLSSAAMREGSCDIAARTPKSCIISPPPIQMIAIETWTNSKNVYQVDATAA